MSAVAPAEPVTPLRSWLGFAAFYASSFAVLAVYMQFFPAWLHGAGGLKEAEVSVVMAAQTVARTLLGTYWAHRVDRRGDARPILLGLAAASVGAFALFGVAPGLAGFAVVAFLFGSLFSPMYPICDAAAMQAAAAHGQSFGRMRVVGSSSYLLALLAMGALVQRSGLAPTYGLLLVGTMAMAATALLLPRAPDQRGATAAAAAPAAAPPWTSLLAQPSLWLLLGAAALIQGSHATFYNLSTLHWADRGIDASVASIVWAEGILAEILLFWFARTTVDRLRPTTLLLLGAAAAVVRWCIVGATTDVVLLLASGWLHAVSFGCTYLGSLRAIDRRVPAPLRATAQGLLGAATSGVGMVVGGLAGGFAYDALAGGAFFVMAAFAAIGGWLSWRLRRAMDVATAKPPSASQSDAAT
ncbi:MAG: MFS transporter [Phycisphaerales bacterium]|nr:MFS transporter [Phycisphaerales bacterium]